jgi:hypothetical protein
MSAKLGLGSPLVLSLSKDEMARRSWFDRLTMSGVAFLAAAVLALPVRAEGGATTAGFLQVPVGARAVAMGGAYTGLAQDAYAMHYNPAGLALSSRQVVFAHNAYLLDLSQEYLAAAYPLSVGTIGASVNYFDYGDFDRTTISNTGAPNTPASFAGGGRFDASNYAISVGYGRQMFNDALHLGVAVKYLHQEIDIYSDGTFAADLGLYYREKDNPLSIGLSVLNLGDKLRMQSRNDRLPITVRGGAAYRAFSDRVVISADVEKTIEDETYYGHVGGEWWVHPMLAVRVGYDATSDAGNGLRLGLGARVQSLSVDYAWSDEKELEDAHRVSLGLEF